MRHAILKSPILAVAWTALTAYIACAADLTGKVQLAGKPVFGADVTLYVAGTGPPEKLSEAKTYDQGAFKLNARHAPGDSVLYVVAKGPKEGVALLSVLGATPPAAITVNELTTVASAFTASRFINGEAISGHPLGLQIAAGNAPNLVDPATGKWGKVLLDPINSTQTATLSTLNTLGSLISAYATVADDAWRARFFKAALDQDTRISLPLQITESENLSYGAVTESPTGEESASELNRKLTNPVSSIWSISNQFNNFELNNGQWNNNWNFQPVLPVSLTKDWNLITRPVMPFYNIVPHETSPGEFARDAGLGDLTLLELLSPAHSGNWVLGAGPTFIFPTATSHFTGQGKWQLGPSVVVGYLTKKFFLGVFPQQWWSIGGEHGRPDTNQMNLQPIATLFFGEGWSIGYSGNILANWTAPSEDVWTVPVGLGLAKVVKLGRLPVKVQLAVQYMPVHPRISGQEWNVQVQITPVIPKLIKGVLFQ